MLMNLLSADIHELFNSKVIKRLNQNEIRTTLQFVHEDINRLSMISNLTIKDIKLLKTIILESISPKPAHGLELYLLMKSRKCFYTNIENLDNMIPEGLPLGIIEICGLSNSGKTQLVYSICINYLLSSTENRVLYLDTKNDFSAVRYQKILEKRSFSKKVMADLMTRTKVVKIWKMDMLVEVLDMIKLNKFYINDIKLIIIDSLPTLLFQYLGDENHLALSLLNKFANTANFISKEKNTRIVCVNIETRWAEQTVENIEDTYENEEGSSRKNWTEKRYRCLGRYWQHIPSLVLQLETISQVSEKDDIKKFKIAIIKSNYCSSNSNCELLLTGKGVE